MSLTEEELVLEAIEGKDGAFAQLYDRHFDKIYRYIYLKVSSRTEAEDLTQDVFLKALGAIGTYRPRQVPFTSWLFRIAHNEVVDYYRKRGKREFTELDENIKETKDDPVTVAEKALEREELKTAIQRLSPAQREVISLRFGAELSIAEVAQTLKKSEGTVKALQFSGVVALRKIFAEKQNV